MGILCRPSTERPHHLVRQSPPYRGSAVPPVPRGAAPRARRAALGHAADSREHTGLAAVLARQAPTHHAGHAGQCDQDSR